MRRPREPRPWPRERRHGPQSGSRGAWCALIGFAVVCALAVNARHMLRLHAAAAAEREGGLLEAWRAEARDAWTGRSDSEPHRRSRPAHQIRLS